MFLVIEADLTQVEGLPTDLTFLKASIPVKDATAAAAIKEAIVLADATDPTPGDGTFEVDIHSQIPVKINWLFIHLNEAVPFEGEAKIYVVDDSPAPASPSA